MRELFILFLLFMIHIIIQLIHLENNFLIILDKLLFIHLFLKFHLYFLIISKHNLS